MIYANQMAEVEVAPMAKLQKRLRRLTRIENWHQRITQIGDGLFELNGKGGKCELPVEGMNGAGICRICKGCVRGK